MKGRGVVFLEASLNVRCTLGLLAGHYGIVRKGVQIGTGLDVAVKTIRKSRVRNVDMIRNEIRILRVSLLQRSKHARVAQQQLTHFCRQRGRNCDTRTS